MEVLLSRPAVVALAVLGALLSICASLLQSAGKLDGAKARWLNRAGYFAMGASILLFALAGLRGIPP